jgi:hypothetical protein
MYKLLDNMWDKFKCTYLGEERHRRQTPGQHHSRPGPTGSETSYTYDGRPTVWSAQPCHRKLKPVDYRSTAITALAEPKFLLKLGQEIEQNC